MTKSAIVADITWWTAAILANVCESWITDVDSHANRGHVTKTSILFSTIQHGCSLYVKGLHDSSWTVSSWTATLTLTITLTLTLFLTQSRNWRDTTLKVVFSAFRQGLICMGTVGNAVPILIFRWERRSHTYSYFPVGTQFLQRSVTISTRRILVAQQTTILPWWMCSCEPCCVSSWARSLSLRQIVIVIAYLLTLISVFFFYL